jgi:hypothetical protein
METRQRIQKGNSARPASSCSRPTRHEPVTIEEDSPTLTASLEVRHTAACRLSA